MSTPSDAFKIITAFSNLKEPGYEFALVKPSGKVIYDRDYGMEHEFMKMLPSHEMEFISHRLLEDTVDKVGWGAVIERFLYTGDNEEEERSMLNMLIQHIEFTIAIQMRKALIKQAFIYERLIPKKESQKTNQKPPTVSSVFGGTNSSMKTTTEKPAFWDANKAPPTP